MGRFMCFIHGIDYDEVEIVGKKLYELAESRTYGSNIEGIDFYNKSWIISSVLEEDGVVALYLESYEGDSFTIRVGMLTTAFDVRNDVVRWCLKHK